MITEDHIVRVGRRSLVRRYGRPLRRRLDAASALLSTLFQAFDENETTLAYLYAEALRGAGFRVRVRAAGGLRPETAEAFRRGRIDMWPAYSGSLGGFLGGRAVKRSLARIGARPMRLSPAENRVFVYDDAGSIVARDVAIGEGGPSGVVDVLLNAPLPLTPGRTYTASYLRAAATTRSIVARSPPPARRARCASPPMPASTSTEAGSRRRAGVPRATT